MKTISKIITVSTMALGLASTIAATPAGAAGYISNAGMSGPRTTPAATPVGCSYFLGCLEGMRPPAHATATIRVQH